ncbi:MAG: hypothetical protein OHK0038_19660 [Flammeovirgaceae bacterium]
MLKYPYNIIFLFLGMLLLPFVVMRDIFPFYRFGMFAEPLPKGVLETFEISFRDEKNQLKYFQSMDYEIPESKLEMWKRNYYYRGEAEKLLLNLKKLQKGKTFDWKLYQIKISPQKTDTLLVYELHEENCL